MKTLLLTASLLITSISTSFAQSPALDQSFLFDEEDVVVRAQDFNESEDIKKEASEKDLSNAINQAKNLLNKKPVNLPKIDIPEMDNIKPSTVNNTTSTDKLKEAPFGLFWGANMATVQSQGIVLQRADLKDYVNSFLASSLPKAIAFFNRVYVVFGEGDELYRILSYSQFIEDDSSAKKTLDEYNKYSQLLEKKYGNKQVFFTPAILEKTIKNAQGKDEVVKEEAPIGNPDFLNQLASGKAVLYSTYSNKDVAAALSIGVDGEKKSYIVIDYKNLKVIQKQEAATLDAL